MDLDIKPERMTGASAAGDKRPWRFWSGAAAVLGIACVSFLAGKSDVLHMRAADFGLPALRDRAAASLSRVGLPSFSRTESTLAGSASASPLATPIVSPVIGPADTVKQLSALDAGGWDPIFSFKGIPYLPHFFTAAFRSDWKRAVDAGGNMLDGDPLTFRASSGGMRITHAVEMIAGDDAEVAVLFDETIEGQTSHGRKAKFLLKVENGIWKVDEVALEDKYATVPLHRYIVEYRDNPNK